MTESSTGTAEPPRTFLELLADQIEQNRLTAVAVADLKTSVDAQARAQRHRTWTNVLLILVLAAAVVDNRIVINRLEKTLCPIVTASVTRPGEVGPSTPHGRDVERSARQLAVRLGCEILPR